MNSEDVCLELVDVVFSGWIFIERMDVVLSGWMPYLPNGLRMGLFGGFYRWQHKICLYFSANLTMEYVKHVFSCS